jgi:hypothetical protein
MALCCFTILSNQLEVTVLCDYKLIFSGGNAIMQEVWDSG